MQVRVRVKVRVRIRDGVGVGVRVRAGVRARVRVRVLQLSRRKLRAALRMLVVSSQVSLKGGLVAELTYTLTHILVLAFKLTDAPARSTRARNTSARSALLALG